MLPDQSHVRTEDWTVFMLYRQKNNPNLEYHIKDIDQKQQATKFYVLNLVNTKFTKDVKRGAIVKAMCIITPHPFFHVFKPLLLLSLDEYFKSPHSNSSLKNLYDSINAIDLSQIPQFSKYERQILMSSTEPSMFIEKFEPDEPQNMVSSLDPRNRLSASSPLSGSSSSSLPLQNHIGNFTSAISPISTSSFSTTLGNISNVDLSPSSSGLSNPRTGNLPSSNKLSFSSDQNSFREISKLSISSPSPDRGGILSGGNSNGASDSGVGGGDGTKPFYYIDLKSKGQKLITRSVTRDTHFFESKVSFSGMKIPIKVPTDLDPESVGDFSLINLIQTFLSINQPLQVLHPELTIYGAYTPPFLVFLNGLLTQKRILFVGLNTPSGEVSDRVLAACSLASGGILRSFTTNAFPYIDLSKADDVMDCPGYIAGVKNPAFGHHAEWWDILVDLENNVMKISPTIGIPGPPISNKSSGIGSGGSTGGDKDKTNAFYNQSLASTSNSEDVQFMRDIKHMVEDHFAESSVRARCREYIKRFIRIASSYEELRIGKSDFFPEKFDPIHPNVPGTGFVWASEAQRAAYFGCYSPVIEGWRNSLSYKCFIKDLQKDWPGPPRYTIDYEFHIDRLRTQPMTSEESGFVYSSMVDHIREKEDITQFLASCGPSKLFYISIGLFHPDPKVRISTTKLLYRVQHHMAGRHFFNAMSLFHQTAYYRQLPGVMKEIQEEANDAANKAVKETEAITFGDLDEKITSEPKDRPLSPLSTKGNKDRPVLGSNPQSSESLSESVIAVSLGDGTDVDNSREYVIMT